MAFDEDTPFNSAQPDFENLLRISLGDVKPEEKAVLPPPRSVKSESPSRPAPVLKRRRNTDGGACVTPPEIKIEDPPSANKRSTRRRKAA